MATMINHDKNCGEQAHCERKRVAGVGGDHRCAGGPVGMVGRWHPEQAAGHPAEAQRPVVANNLSVLFISNVLVCLA